MLVTIPGDLTRRYALAAFWPGTGRRYYDWIAGEWVARHDPACLLPFAPDPHAMCGDLLVAHIPDHLATGAVILQLVALDAGGQPVQTVDCEVLLPLPT